VIIYFQKFDRQLVPRERKIVSQLCFFFQFFRLEILLFSLFCLIICIVFILDSHCLIIFILDNKFTKDSFSFSIVILSIEGLEEEILFVITIMFKGFSFSFLLCVL